MRPAPGAGKLSAGRQVYQLISRPQLSLGYISCIPYIAGKLRDYYLDNMVFPESPSN